MTEEDKYNPDLQPYATDFGPQITEAINKILEAFQPIPIILADEDSFAEPIDFDLGKISNAIKGRLYIP